MSDDMKQKCQYAFCPDDAAEHKKMCGDHLKYHAKKQREYRARLKQRKNAL